MCGSRYHDAETNLPATCRTVSSKLHRATSAILPVIAKPLYSLDLAPNDFWLFPTLKVDLKGMHFATMGDIKSNVTAKLRKIPKVAFCW
jgi:hypothetical protein